MCCAKSKKNINIIIELFTTNVEPDLSCSGFVFFFVLSNRFECYYDGKKISFYRLYDDGKKNRINQQSNITTKKLSKRKHGRHISVDFTIDN